MKRFFVTLLVSLVFAYPSSGRPMPTAGRSASSVTCDAASKIQHQISNAESITALELQFAGEVYRVMRDGSGFRGATLEDSQHFELAIGSEFSVNHLFACGYEGNLVLTVEIDDGESGGGVVFLLENKTLATKWKADIPGFAVAAPVINGRSAYVSGLGFVGCLDLRSGRFHWRHTGLYDDGEYHSFLPAEPDGAQVVFRDAGAEKANVLPIVINARSGAIMSPDSARRREANPRKLSCGEFAAPRPC